MLRNSRKTRYSRNNPPIEMMNDESLTRLECACMAILLCEAVSKPTADRVYLRLCRIRAVRFERE